MGLSDILLKIIGRTRVTCPRCHGTGKNARGDWCWPCSGTGVQVITKDGKIS